MIEALTNTHMGDAPGLEMAGLAIDPQLADDPHFWYLAGRKYIQDRMALPKDFAKITTVRELAGPEAKGEFKQVIRGASIRQALDWAKHTVALEAEAATDGLTGILNRKAIDRLLLNLAAHKKPGTVDAIVMLDVDHFKLFNDTYGHGVGDAVLRELTALISQQLKRTDWIGRYGGEEFVIVLPEVNGEVAAEWKAEILARVDAIRAKIQQELKSRVEKAKEITIDGDITASFGLFFAGDTVKPATEHELDDQVYLPADQALYEAKHAGRNALFTPEGRYTAMA